MKIVTYNVNGIRSAVSKGLLAWIQNHKADVYCFQEIKAHEEDIDTAAFEAIGYHCYWFSAQKKGYSGVGIISKQKPKEVIKGCGIERADYEGRVIQAIYDNGLHVLCTYFPSGSDENKQAFKIEFLDKYLQYLNTTFKMPEFKLVVAGDYNICHKAIDIHDPVSNKNSSGFLPEERTWMDMFFDSGMIDTFRYINPHPHQYSWWSYRANARNNNKGWRIDYINVSKALENNIKDAMILPDILHSDHCPVVLELDV